MAGISVHMQFSCKSVWAIPSRSEFSSKPSLLPINSSKFNAAKSSTLWRNARTVFRVRPESEGGPESENEPELLSPVILKEEKPPKEPTEIDLLKEKLIDSFYGTDRGLNATTDVRAQILELITQVEAKNPTPAPTEALSLLNGKWIFVYTSFIGMHPLSSNWSLVKVDDISQTFDTENFSIQDSVLFSGMLTTKSISINGKFEVQSPLRVQIKIEEGMIGTPQLTNSIVFPDNVELLGQNIDLTPLKGLITPVQDAASFVAKTISSQPPFKFPIPNYKAKSWLLITYLDEELRISRGDGGSVFVLVKEGSYLLSP